MPPDREENPKSPFTLPEGIPKRKMAILDQILDSVRATIPALDSRVAEMARRAEKMPAPQPFLGDAATRPTIAVISEVKRRSPSLGAINESLDPVTLAASYAAGGAAAISVLTEVAHFGGSVEDLSAVSRAVSLPVLRKDFILAESQIVEARTLGAAAVLLIVRALPGRALEDLLTATRRWGLAALVEVHTHSELDRAIEAGAEIIGVNSRDLDTLVIDTEPAMELVASVPADRVAIAESGMSSVADVELAARAGADPVLLTRPRL
jgi:indole-3-glycerol phosphate synthase